LSLGRIRAPEAARLSTARNSYSGKVGGMYALRLIELRSKPGHMSAVRQIYNAQILPAIRAMAGHHSSHLMEGVTDPDEALGWIVWDEVRFADFYVQSDAFAGHIALIRHLLAEEPEIRAYIPV
jgi:quinol monooxygenase YgiN